jgi:LysR family glycine cleavage system transcriptional activator
MQWETNDLLINYGYTFLYLSLGTLNLDNKHQRLPLTALRIFEVAARLQSFKQAAEELNVTPATVSNQVRRLERDWDCLLFIRKPRQLLLTDAGRSLAQVVSRSFDDIRTEIDTHIARLNKTITLAVGPIFASRWLIPRLNRFRRQHPGIELVLHHGPRISAVQDMITDVAVDWGTGGWSGLEFTHLMNILYLPVLSPALARAKGGLDKPADLARFTILHQHDRSEWRAWLASARVSQLDFVDETIIADANVAVQAAIDGQGVALGTFPFIQSDLDSGRLICPLDIALEPTRCYHLLTRPGARKNVEIESVCAWLANEADISRINWRG